LFDGGMTRGESTRFRVAQGSTIVLDETRSSVDDYVEAFYLFQREFVDAVRNGYPPPLPARENLQTLEMTFAAYAAAEQDRPVSFREFQGLI
jgi:predicted dehydrogenase